MSTPAVEIRSFAVTIPANTPITAPVTELVAFPPRVVTEIHWRVPPGPVGFMGWKLTMSGGQNLLPVNGTFIVVDNHADQWLVVNQPDGGQWEVTGYNTDIYDHTVYLDFFLDLVGGPTPPPPLMSNESLSSPSSVTTPPPVTVPPITTAAITTPPLVTVPGG